MTTRTEKFLWNGYTHDQEVELKRVRDELVRKTDTSEIHHHKRSDIPDLSMGGDARRVERIFDKDQCLIRGNSKGA
jgi:hypothetical protein